MRLFSLFFLSLFPYLITCQETSLIGGDYSLVNSGTNFWSIQNISHFGNNPDIGVIPGGIVTFRLQQSSQHPFGFSTVKGDKNQPSVTTKNYQIEADGGCRFYALSAGTPTAAYLPVDTSATPVPCILKWTVPATFKTGDLFYQCHGHPAMTGAFFVQAASTDNSTSGTTTATTSTTATPTTATPTTTPNPTTTTPPTNPTTTTPPTNPTTTTPPTNSSTTSPPTNSGNVTNPTNTTSSSSSSTGIVGSSSTAVGGVASNLLPSIGIIMFLIAAVMATIPL